jgi:hypothetical protein
MIQSVASPPLVPPLPYRPRASSNAHLADSFGWWCAAAVVAVWLVACVIGFSKAMALFALLGFGGGLLGLRFPILGMYSIGVLCVLDTPMRSCLSGSSPIFRDNSLNYLLLLYSGWFLPQLARRRDPHTWLLVSLILLLGCELLMSPGFDRGLLHVINATAPVGMLVVVSRGARDERVWFWMALLCGLTAAIGGGIYFWQKEGLPYIDRNGLAYFPLSGMFAICVGFRYARHYSWGTLLLGSLAALCGCWVVLTTSRGGTVTGIFAVICLLANLRGLGNRLLLLFMSVVIGYGILTQYADTLSTTLGRFDKLTDTDRSLAARTSGRSDLMKGAWEMFLDHPFGVGTGAFSNEYAERSQSLGEFTFGAGKMASSHSAWMKTLAENGWPGFLLLLAYVLSFAWVGFTKRHAGLLTIGILPTAAFSVAFFTSEFQGKGLWFLAAGVTCLLHEAPRRVASLGTAQRNYYAWRVR